MYGAAVLGQVLFKASGMQKIIITTSLTSWGLCLQEGKQAVGKSAWKGVMCLRVVSAMAKSGVGELGLLLRWDGQSRSL